MEINGLLKKIKVETPYFADHNEARGIIDINVNKSITFMSFNEQAHSLSEVDMDYLGLYQFGHYDQQDLDNIYKLVSLVNLYLNTCPNNRGLSTLYTIQVIDGADDAYLIYSYLTDTYTFGTIKYDPRYKRAFTETEIKDLKEENEVALDWDNVIIRPLEV